MARRDEFTVGLDAGSKDARVVIAEKESKGIQIVAVGRAECGGVEHGKVRNLQAASEAIARAVDSAARMAGYSIARVVLGVGDDQLEGSNSHGVVGLSHGRVRAEDRDRVLDIARARMAAPGREIVQMLPQRYLVDDTEDSDLPIGISGAHLEARAHVVTASKTSLENLDRCLELARVAVHRRVASPVAASRAVLYDDERELGVVLVDIGEDTTGVAIWHDQALVHLVVIPAGGGLITRDVAFGLKTRRVEAERIKCLHGCASVSRVDEEDLFDVPSVGGRPPTRQSRRFLAELIELRVEEIMERVREEICNSGYAKHLRAGVVLTGGTASLEAIGDIAEDVLGADARVGSPHGVGGLKDMVAEPGFATAVGLAMCGFEEAAVWDTDIGTPPTAREPILTRIAGLVRQGRSYFF